MAYSPNNPSVYVNAYAAALASMAQTGVLTDTKATDYLGLCLTADAYAQSFDAQWGTAPANAYQLAAVSATAGQFWSQRSGTPTGPPFNAAATWNPVTSAQVAMIGEGATQLANEGITPPGPQTPANLQGNIFIDPTNSTGKANDNGPGTAANPFLTYNGGCVAKWGTTKPVLTQNTTLTFLGAGHSDNTDPVVFDPIVRGTAVVAIKGTLLAIASPALSGKVSKNRTVGSNSMLQGNIGVSGAIRQFVTNASRPSGGGPSRGFTYRSLGANAFEITQPMAVTGVGGTFTPAEVDTWANTDNLTLNNMTSVNIVRVQPTYTDSTGTLSIVNVQFFDPLGFGGFSPTTLDCEFGQIQVSESIFQRLLMGVAVGGNPLNLINCLYTGAGAILCGSFNCIGGAVDQTCTFFTIDSYGQNFTTIDGDIAIGAASAQWSTSVRFQVGFMFLDTNVLVESGIIEGDVAQYGGPVIYGRTGKTIQHEGSSKFALTVGTFTNAFTAPGLVVGIQLNGAATGSSHTSASPDVLNSGITTTPAHLDAAAGATGFGGNAFVLGGAACNNFR